MKKIFTRNLCIYMLIALLLTVTAIFSFQTLSAFYSNQQNAAQRLTAVKEQLEKNDLQIAQLTESLGQSALAKARAVSHILSLKPEMVKDQAALKKLCELLIIDEIHIINGKGFLEYGTVDDYIGLDFATGDQTRPFIDIIKDPSIELVQEPQENSAAGILFQYIGVARTDEPGVIQVGVRPEVLEEMLATTSIDKALASIGYGDTGYIFAIDSATGAILAENNEALIGANALESGYPQDVMSGSSGTAMIGGNKGHYVSEVYNGMVIGAMLPDREYYQMRTNQTVIFSICLTVIFLALILLINRMVNKKIVRGIQSISADVEKIAGGNLDTVIQEKENPEFIQLSDSLNSMVTNIKENLRQNEDLLKQQKEDMESSRNMIRNVKAACENIDHVSQETLKISQEIQSGSVEQEQAVKNLHEAMEALSDRLRDSAGTSLTISDSTNHSVENMLKTKDNMELLSQAIGEIANTSAEIEKIISEIDAIATQTNMLSLNASIEAARAGEAGRGFAVVASQVGELAARSTQAAKETGTLIMTSIEAVNRGKEITRTAVEEFLQVVEEIEKAGKDVAEISSMASGQVELVNSAVEGLDRISQVVEKNSVASGNSEVTSENLAREAAHLRELVEQ